MRDSSDCPTVRLTYRRRQRRWSAETITEFAKHGERKARAAVWWSRVVRLSSDPSASLTPGAHGQTLQGTLSESGIHLRFRGPSDAQYHDYRSSKHQHHP